MNHKIRTRGCVNLELLNALKREVSGETSEFDRHGHYKNTYDSFGSYRNEKTLKSDLKVEVNQIVESNVKKEKPDFDPTKIQNVFNAFNISVEFSPGIGCYVAWQCGAIWHKTGCSTKESAFADVIRELKLRCYIPIDSEDLYSDASVSVETNRMLQRDVLIFGEKSANHIKCAYNIFDKLSFILNRVPPTPWHTRFDSRFKKYEMCWKRDFEDGSPKRLKIPVTINIHKSMGITVHNNGNTQIMKNLENLEAVASLIVKASKKGG